GLPAASTAIVKPIIYGWRCQLLTFTVKQPPLPFGFDIEVTPIQVPYFVKVRQQFTGWRHKRLLAVLGHPPALRKEVFDLLVLGGQDPLALFRSQSPQAILYHHPRDGVRSLIDRNRPRLIGVFICIKSPLTGAIDVKAAIAYGYECYPIGAEASGLQVEGLAMSFGSRQHE